MRLAIRGWSTESCTRPQIVRDLVNILPMSKRAYRIDETT